MKRIVKIPPKNDKQSEETLRGENRRLIKEVKRLRSRLNKREQLDHDVWEKYEKESEDIPGKVYICPKCGGSDVHTMELRHKLYIFCQDCNHRGPVSD